MELGDINRAITLLQNKLNDNAFDFNDNTIDPNRTYKFIKRKRMMIDSSNSTEISDNSVNNDITIVSDITKQVTIKSNKSQDTNMFDKFLKEEQIIIQNIENQIKSLGLNIS